MTHATDTDSSAESHREPRGSAQPHGPADDVPGHADDHGVTHGHGGEALGPAAFFGRMIPVIRSLVSFAAGVARAARPVHAVHVPRLPAMGVRPRVRRGQLGANWEAVGGVLKRFEYAVIGLLVLVALAWIWFRIVKPRRARPA